MLSSLKLRFILSFTGIDNLIRIGYLARSFKLCSFLIHWANVAKVIPENASCALN